MNKGAIAILAALGGAVVGGIGIGKTLNNRLIKQTQLSDKHLSLYLMMNQWVKVKQKNQSIAEYLERKGYKEIAIYGMNYVGKTLKDELMGTNVKIIYGIDKNASNIDLDIDVLTPSDELPQVDAVVVTAITFLGEIEETLSKKMDCPVLSIEDILYELK